MHDLLEKGNTMIGRLFSRCFAATAVALGLASASFAGGVAYQPESGVSPDKTTGPKVIVPAQAHPEVAVPPSLAAQPVNPYHVELELRTMSTWIDITRKITGEHKLDDEHTLARAQRVARMKMNLTTTQLNLLRNLREAGAPRDVFSRARVIRKVNRRVIRPSDMTGVPVSPAEARPAVINARPFVPPVRHETMPAVPRPEKQTSPQVAAAD